MGKSRLLREIKYLAQVRDLTCLWFDRFRDRDGFDQLKNQLSLPPFHTPEQFFQSALDALRALGPAVLLVDDFQEADPLFCEWLSRLKGSGCRYAILMGWEGALPRDGSTVPPLEGAQVLPLARFNADQIQVFLSEFAAGEGFPQAQVQWLTDFSEGNPLLLGEGIRYLIEHRGEGKLPESVEKLYEGELAKLGSDSRSVLETLALWRDGPTLDQLEISVPMNATVLTALMPSLLIRGLVTRLADAYQPEIRYEISNTALGLLLQGSQEAGSRRKRLARILDHLELGSHPLAELAAYARQAGDLVRLMKYLPELGGYFHRSFQTQKAIQVYQELLPLAGSDEQFAEGVREKLIPLMVLAGRPDEALALFSKKGPVSLADKKLMGWILTRTGRFQEAEALYQQGIQQSDESNPLHPELLNALANVHLQRREAEKAVTLFESTLPPPSVPEEERFRLLGNNNLGLALALVGRIEEARRFETERLDLFRKVGDRHQIAAALSQLGFIELKGERYYQAVAFFKEALALSEELGDYHNILILLDNLITVCQRRGWYAEAIGYLNEATNYRSVVSPPYQQIQSLLKATFLYLTIGLTDLAERSLGRISVYEHDPSFERLRGWVSLARGYYLRSVGEKGKAAALFAGIPADFPNDLPLLLWAYYAGADLAAEQGEWEQAVSQFQAAASRVSDREDEELRLRLRLLELILRLGKALPAEGDPAEKLKELAQECELKGMMELAAECYCPIKDRRAREIYYAIASRLPS